MVALTCSLIVGNDDWKLRERLCFLAAEWRHFRYSWLGVVLRRESFTVNHKRFYRLYRDEGCVRMNTQAQTDGRGRLSQHRCRTKARTGVAQWTTWLMRSGQRTRVLGVIDDFTRECLATSCSRRLARKG